MIQSGGSGDQPPIAYSQFEAVYYREAERGGWLREAMADTLARKLREHLRSGWNCGRNVIQRQAEAISSWELPLCIDPSYAEVANQIWRAIKSSSPADDWCPTDGNDAVLQKAFSDVWPSV
jgi:hypothetical protein